MSSIKIQRNKHLEISDIILKREIDILNRLKHPSILVENESSESYEIILAKEEYLSIRSLVNNYTFSELEICDIIINLVDVLNYIWSKSLIFNNINPDTLFYNTKTKKIKLVNFKNSSETSLDYATIGHVTQIKGDLHFISPEQTGRIGRNIDYRSDIYGLGALAYYIITGSNLFTEKEPHKIIHAHITRDFKPLVELNKHIHPIFQQLVSKMLEKNSEDRYQTADGITEDINQLKSIIRYETEESSFQIGQGDLISRFEIPQKIYGRTEEKNKILNMVHLTANSKSRILLVSGYSGIGKTALVNEVKKPITEYNGLFVSGKFDQFKKNNPYIGISQALGRLIDFILLENQRNIEIWKNKIINTVGDSLHLLLDIVPNLESLVGEQEIEYKNLDTTALQNILNKTFKDFISCFKKQSYPLVIFLDDLQWADQSTLNLVRYLFNDIKDKHLMLICGYRNNEVDKNHPFQISIDQVSDAGARVEEIMLVSLRELDFIELLSDTLKRNDNEIKELAAILYKKTRGNPFFTISLLKNLYEKEYIKFDRITKRWDWNKASIAQEQFGDNLIEILMKKLDTLTHDQLTTLQHASILGTKFSLKDITQILDISKIDIVQACKKLIENELIIPLDENYKYIEHSSNTDIDSSFKFTHDKIQEASNELLSEEDKTSIHIKIAQYYKESYSKNKTIDIFELIFHLNKARKENVFSQSEVIELNEIAATKAYESSSYMAAMNFLEVAFNSLPDKKWETHYAQSLRIATHLSENYYLCAKTQEAEDLYNLLLSKAKTKEDKAKIFEIQMNYYTNQGRADDAISIGSEALKLYGINFPKKVTFIQVLPKLLKIKTKLLFRSDSKILGLPEIENKDALASMKILSNMSPSCFVQSPESMLLNCLNCLDLTLKYGISDVSSYAVSLMAFVETIALGNHSRAFELVKLAYDMNDKVNGKMYRSKLIFAYNNFIQLYHAPIEESINELKMGHVAGINCGDFNFADYCLYSTFSREIYLGRDLTKVYENAVDYSRFADNISDQYIIPMMQVMRRYISELTGHFDPQYESRDKNFNAEEFKNKYVTETDKQNQSWLYIFESMLCYFKRDIKSAYEQVLKAEVVCEDGTQKQIPLYDHYFFSTLICCEMATLDKSTWKMASKIASKNLRELEKVQKQMPKNFRSRYFLALAIKKMVFAPQKEKEISFDFINAISISYEDDYLHIEALACELYGRYLRSKNIALDSAHYLQRAIDLYSRWGANFKVASLKEELSNTQTNDLNKQIDINTFIDVSQSFSNERDLEVLFKNILETSVSFSNSHIGAIFRRDNSKYIIISKDDNTDINNYPQSLIDYAYNSSQIIRIDSRNDLQDYNKDSFFDDNEVCSILILPLIANGEIESVLYLANDQTDKVYTADKTRVLEIISTQMALSIKNAFLFKNLERLVSERTQALEEKTVELELSSKDKETLIRVLCHDLANLLMSGRISFNRLQKTLKNSDIVDEKLEKYLQKISTSFTNQSRVIDNVRHLELAKEEGFKIELKDIDISKVITESIDTFEQQISIKNINIVISEELTDIKVLADELSLGVNIINNLVSNAIKFTFEDGTIEIGLAQSDQHFHHIYIQDSGIGMKDEMVRGMFKDNIHTSTKGTNSEPGSGFGLSIIKSYIGKMEGDITVKSKHKDDFPEESGTRFTLKLKKGA